MLAWLTITNGGPCSISFCRSVARLQGSGFDVANFFADMISGFDPVREASGWQRSTPHATAPSPLVRRTLVTRCG